VRQPRCPILSWQTAPTRYTGCGHLSNIFAACTTRSCGQSDLLSQAASSLALLSDRRAANTRHPVQQMDSIALPSVFHVSPVLTRGKWTDFKLKPVAYWRLSQSWDFQTEALPECQFA
jgi:hypothetical protein